MSIIDEALKANQAYAKKYDRTVGAQPAPKIVLVPAWIPDLPTPCNPRAAARRYRRYPNRRASGHR